MDIFPGAAVDAGGLKLGSALFPWKKAVPNLAADFPPADL
jgi:hypothetical protein